MSITLSALLALSVASASPWVGSPDPDQDGIHSAYDACPDEAEDFDGYQDEDGCADPTRTVFIFTDPSGARVVPEVVIEGFGPLPNRRYFGVGLHAGEYTLNAALDGFAPLTAVFTVPGGQQHRVTLVLSLP